MAPTSEKSTRLTDSVDAAVLQEMQDAFAALAQASMSICDPQGRLVTRPSCCGPLCSVIQQSTSGQAACAQSIGRRIQRSESGEPLPHLAGAIHAGSRVEAGAPVASLPVSAFPSSCQEQTCHAGVRQLTVPIEHDGQALGTIVVGDRPPGPLTPEQVHLLAREHGLDEAALQRAARDAIPWTERQRQATLDCAHLLANAIARLCGQDLMIRDRVEELSAVYNLAGMLSGTQDLDAILAATASRVAEVMRVKACAIRLLDESTGELVIKAVHNLSQAYLNKGPVVLGHNPIDDAAFAGETVHILDATNDSRIRYPEEARKEGIASGLCVAMTHRGQAVGVIRVYTGVPHRFSLFEASLLRAIASQIAAAIVNARLFAQRRDAERTSRALHYAGEIQRRMIPEEPPRHKNLSFAGVYAPTLEVGGDFYDFISLPWNNLGICIADVVGKGVPAALLMASVRSALRGHARSIFEINDVIAQVNRHLFRDTLASEFVTLFYGVFSPDGGQITYCNAGHEPPLLLRGQQMRRLNAGGMVIGVSPDAAYAHEVVDLLPGDVLVFVTDGITEAMNFQGEAYGRERLEDSLRRYSHEEVRILATQLVWDVRRFTGLAPQNDDITLVAVRVG